MKKNLLITLDFPPNFGGVSAYYYNICKNLPNDKITVLAPANESANDFDSKQEFTILRSDVFASRVGKYLSIFKIIKIIKTQKIGLIHVGNILPIGTLAWLIKKLIGTPYLVYSHGLDVIYPQKFWHKKLLMQLIINDAEILVTNSQFTKNELIKLGAMEKKIVVVNPCSDFEVINFSQQEVDNFKNEYQLQDKKILLTAGRLVKRKGHDQVIMALPEIIKSVPGVVYVIAGAGEMLDDLKQLANELGIAEYIRFLGGVAKNELALCYTVADVFIMPSRQLPDGDVEGFGIVYLEANLYNKPVIGGRSGGVPEAVIDGQTGLLVDAMSTPEIAQASIKLLTDRDYGSQLGAQGATRAKAEFTWPKQVQKLIDVLNK